MAIDLSGIDLQSILFEQILKVHPTGDFQADFLNLIFFPHLIIVIWLFFIAKSPVFIALHRGLGFLLSTAIYVFIIYYGWYSMIASLSMVWLTLTILISLFYFMFPKILHPSVTKERFNIGQSIRGSVSDKRNITKAIEALGEDIKSMKQTIAYHENIRSSNASDDEKAEAVKSINQLQLRIHQFEQEKRKLENMKWF